MVSSAYNAPNKLLQPSFVALGTTWNVLAEPCRNVVRLAKVATPSLARSRVFIILHALEPHAGADLVNSLADMHSVGIGEKIAPVPRPGGIVGARRGDAGKAGGGHARR